MTLLCLATTVVAESKIYDDPAKCDSGCTNKDKYCASDDSDCVYRNATEYPCKDGSHCPEDYDCGNDTYVTLTCVSNPDDTGPVLVIFIIIAFFALIGVLIYMKYKWK